MYEKFDDEFKTIVEIKNVVELLKQVREATIQEILQKVEIENIYELNCQDHTPYRGKCGNCGSYHNFKVLAGSKIKKKRKYFTIR